MSQKIKLLAFAGSTREDSFNKKLIKLAAEYAREEGAEVTLIDLRDYPLPLFDQDCEAKEGLPENGRKIKDLMIAHDGFLISTPEYNGFFSGVLKNMIDWASRPVEGYPPYECFEGKTAGLLAASPGGGGGMRALPHLRHQLSNVRVLVIHEHFGLGSAGKAFDENGNLVNEKQAEAVKNVVKKLVKVTSALK